MSIGKILRDYEGFKRGDLIMVTRIRDNFVTGKKQYKFIIDARHSIEFTESILEIVDD
jgi:hypothetical protein